MANNSEILGEEAAVRQIVENDFSATDGHFEDDSVITLRTFAFRNKTALKSISLPNVTTIQNGSYLFGSANYIKRISMPKLNNNSNQSYMFSGCGRMYFLELDRLGIGNRCFENCTSLVCLILRSNSISNLAGSNGFYNTKYATDGAGGAYVYVPRDLISTYQTSTNWSTLYAAHSDMFRALEDYTVDGTTTGAIDESEVSVRHTPIYSLRNQEFDGNTYVDTGLALLDGTHNSWSICLDVTIGDWTTYARILYCNNETSNPDRGIQIQKHNNNNTLRFLYESEAILHSLGSDRRYKILLQYSGTKTFVYVYGYPSLSFASYNTTTTASPAMNDALIVGARKTSAGTYDRFFNGTVNSLTIYDGMIDLWEAEETLDI